MAATGLTGEAIAAMGLLRDWIDRPGREARLLESRSSRSASEPIAMSQTATAPANAEKRYTVTRADLPLSCPLPSMALWNSHPRVYLSIEDEPNGEADCPYCGSHFVLAD
jgi:uncharacterized Zn-finger protein